MPEDEVIIKVDDLEQMGWVEMVDPEE